IIDTAVDRWNTDASKPDGQTVEKGGAGAVVPPYSSRNVLTYTGSDASPATPVDLISNANHRIEDANTAITKTLLGDATMSDQTRTDIIQWIRGQDIEDEDGNNITSENRWAFQDPLHSQLRPVTYGEDLSQTDPDKQTIIKLFIGTNDGALRMIDAESGAEDWIFYPQTVLGDQNARRINANGPHLYGMDGSPSIWIQDQSLDADGVTIIDKSDGKIDPVIGDFVRVIIGMRRGGAAIYALDVTPDALITASGQPVLPKFMWRIDPGNAEFNALGQTWSRPKVTDIRFGTGAGGNNVAKTVLIFGGGYDDSQDAVTTNLANVDEDEVAFGPDAVGNAIYIVDPNDGNRLWWASDPGTGADQPDLALPGMDYSFPADFALLDSNGDGETDRLYATDVGGQIWRIDLSPTLREDTNSGSTGARLAALSDYSATPLEIDKRKFFYSVDVVRIRDTQNSFKADFDVIAAVSGNRAHPLDLDVQNRVFAIRDYQADVLIELDASN
ncbi:MAG: pilus assembly protein, partial [Pirellulales bacterium]